jgi:PHD/YefM family antitoxin component YafN of YafNO toxin-antitoxin module
MNLPSIRPLSYLAENAAEAVQQVNDTQAPLAITVDGQVRAVMQDAASYRKMGDKIAMLRMLTLGKQEIAEGRVLDHDAVVALLAAEDQGR